MIPSIGTLLPKSSSRNRLEHSVGIQADTLHSPAAAGICRRLGRNMGALATIKRTYCLRNVQMRLADFIMRDMEPILGQWEAFATTLLPAAEDMGPLALRDHAQQILQAVAKDLRTPQNIEEQRSKSWGQAPRLTDATETAAQTHALLRARAGFNINQLVAEYRALRASVLRLWMDDCAPDVPYLHDVVRFDEAIDQALAESVSFFSSQVEENRNLLLGMLGHDMRNPLQAIQMTASHLAALNADEKVSDAAARLIRSGARMQSLLDDLSDFNRTRLGLGIKVKPTDINLAGVIADELDEVRDVHPDRQIDLRVNGDLHGVWDAQRVQQIVQNLVLNALKYGARDTPVRVEVTGDSTHVRIDVRNRGRAIEPATLRCMFNPLTRGPDDRQRASDEGESLGLGLYIASEIAKAHHGAIEARSDEAETSFSVSLPRADEPPSRN